MQSLLAIDIGFDVRATDMLVRLEHWRDGVTYHPDPGSCMGKAEIRSACIETVAETLAKAGYSVIVAKTATGREVQCTTQELAPVGDRPGYEWTGPAWAIQAKNDNYWCVGPSLLAVLQRSGWRDSELTPLDGGQTEPPAETPREQINARMRRIRDLDRDLKAWTDAAERLDGWQCGSDEYGDPSEDTEAAAAYHGVCAMIARARKLRRTLLNEVAAIEQQHGLATTPEDILVGFEPPGDIITPGDVDALAAWASDTSGQSAAEAIGAQELERLERLGAITIERPVDENTGLPYGVEHWRVTIAPGVLDDAD